jgi:uncharacterized protein (DUF58 family)
VSLRQPALLLILLTGLVGIVGTWSGSPSMSRWWALPAALLLAGLAYEAAMLGRKPVELDVQAPERWPLGRLQVVRFAFRQHSRRRLHIQVVLSAPEELAAQPRIQTLELLPGTPAVTTLNAAPRRLGRYAWPAPTLRVSGVFRLAWWLRPVATECEITVVPDLIERLERTPGERGLGAQQTRAVGAGAEVLQLRDYVRGDALRSIDWKATARCGHLVTRDFTEEQHIEVIVAIDSGRASGLGAGEADRLGLYVNVAARFAQRAAAQGDAVGVVLFAAQPLALLPPARGEAAVGRLRELLTACRVQPSESNPVLAAARIRAIAPRRSLILFLTDLEDRSAGEQLAKAVQLLTPKHLPFIAGFRSERIEALASAPAREPIGAYRALAALEYTRIVEANVRALRALGAAALIARPADLDAAVLSAYRQFREQRRI